MEDRRRGGEIRCTRVPWSKVEVLKVEDSMMMKVAS